MKDKQSPDRNPSASESIEREMAHHIDALTRDYLARGLPWDEARRRAHIDFGGSDQVRQSVREVHVSEALAGILFNLKAARRFLRKSPGFSIAVILTLALGIGANSAVFSAVDAVVLRPLPFPDGDQLVELDQHDVESRDANHFVAPVRLEDWNRLNSTLQSVSGYYRDDLSETSGSLPEKVTEALVAPRFLGVLGVAPAVGRGFTPGEEHWGGPNAALISYGFWQRRFGGDPGAVGQKLHLDGFSYTVVGVMPASFHFPGPDVDLWAPSAPDAPFAKRRDATWFTVIGRLRPGVSAAQAGADLNTVQSGLGKQYAKPDSELNVRVTPLKTIVVGGVRDSLWLIYGSVSLLLMIACSNIAALLLARTTERELEVSLRFSLGASRRAIVLQLLTEVFVLSLLGSLLGLLVAAAAAHQFQSMARTLPRAGEIGLNGQVVAYSLLAAVTTTVFCGLLPALRGTRTGLAKILAAGSRTQVSLRNPGQWVLVGIQVTLAVTLLVGAGLLLRSLEQIGRVYPGFDPTHVLTFHISGSWGETSDMKSVKQRIERSLETLRTLPGIVDAATAGALPGASWRYQAEFKIDGKLGAGYPILADNRWVSAGYFETLRIPILVGASCPSASTTSDVLVNRSFADRYMSAASPLGHELSGALYNDFGTRGIVRGIVADAREEGINLPPVPTVYSCFSAPDPFPNYLVRTRGEPMAEAEAIRRRIHAIDPARSVYAFMPLEEHLDDAATENRLRTGLLSLFAGTALSLACIGLYGTLSYLGRLRRREVGVRLALGAGRGQIVARFLGIGLRVTAMGCVTGLALGAVLSHFLRGMLYGVTALDPATYGSVVCLLLLVAAASSFLPAIRAARVDPVKVLRDE